MHRPPPFAHHSFTSRTGGGAPARAAKLPIARPKRPARGATTHDEERRARWVANIEAARAEHVTLVGEDIAREPATGGEVVHALGYHERAEQPPEHDDRHVHRHLGPQDDIQGTGRHAAPAPEGDRYARLQHFPEDHGR